MAKAAVAKEGVGAARAAAASEREGGNILPPKQLLSTGARWSSTARQLAGAGTGSGRVEPVLKPKQKCLLTKFILNRYEPRGRDGGDGGGSGKVIGRERRRQRCMGIGWWRVAAKQAMMHRAAQPSTSQRIGDNSE